MYVTDDILYTSKIPSQYKSEKGRFDGLYIMARKIAEDYFVKIGIRNYEGLS